MMPYGALPAQMNPGNTSFYVDPLKPLTYYTITSVYTSSYTTLPTAYGEMWVPTGIAQIGFSATVYPVSGSIGCFARVLVDGQYASMAFCDEYCGGAGWARMVNFQLVWPFALDQHKKHTFQVQVSNAGASSSFYIYHGGNYWPLTFWGMAIDRKVM